MPSTPFLLHIIISKPLILLPVAIYPIFEILNLPKINISGPLFPPIKKIPVSRQGGNEKGVGE
jgi:hypothetical protein